MSTTQRRARASVEFHNLRIRSHHFVGTGSGNTDDLRDSLRMMERRIINPASLIAPVGGLGCAAGTTPSFSDISGGYRREAQRILMRRG